MNIICHSFCRDLRGFIVAVFDRFCFAPSLTRNELRPSAFTQRDDQVFQWMAFNASLEEQDRSGL